MTAGRWRPLAVSALVAGCLLAVWVLVIAGGSDGAAPTAPEADSRGRGLVLFVGDSNLTLAATSITWRLSSKGETDGPVPVLVSRVGSSIRTHDCFEPDRCKTTNYWKSRLDETLSNVSADVVVINLGINDTPIVGTETSPGYTAYDAKVDWFMTLIPADMPVLWTNLPCSIEPPARATGCKAVNDALDRAPTRWPNLTVIDWQDAARGHPEYMAAPGDVHFSSAGYTAWADLVVKALEPLPALR